MGRLVAVRSYPHASSDGGAGGSESGSTRRAEIGWRRCVFLAYEIGSGWWFFVFLDRTFQGIVFFVHFRQSFLDHFIQGDLVMRLLLMVLLAAVVGCGNDPLSFSERKETMDALGVAAGNGNLAKVKRLLKRLPKKSTNPIPYDREDGRRRALHEAAWGGHLDIVEYLVGSGADVNAKYNDGSTALHKAAWEGHLDVVEFLVGAGADVHARTNGGQTALHWAADDGHLDVVEFLVGAGAAVDAREKNGGTALHWAAAEGHLSVVQYLVGAGANVNLQWRQSVTRPGEFFAGLVLNLATGFAFDIPMDTQTKGTYLTARDLARRNGHTAVVSYFDSLDEDGDE